MVRILIIVMVIFIIISGCGRKVDTSRVVATVNGEHITIDDLERQLEEMPPVYQEMFLEPANKEKLLARLIKERLLLQEAKKAGLHKRKDIQEKINALKEQILIQEIIKLNIMDKVTITDEEVKEYYEANKSKIRRYTKGKSFDEIRGKIKEIALQEKQDKAFERWIEELKSKATITKNLELLRTAEIKLPEQSIDDEDMEK
jgi:hypothetical protein